MKAAMARRVLGRTGLQITELSFGAMNLRRLRTPSETAAIVNYVLDCGVNLLDTARAYNGELPDGELIESEVIIGNTIRARRDLTEPLVIITKGHGYTPDAFECDLNTSLSKLGVSGRYHMTIGANPIKLVYFFHGINRVRWASINESGVLAKALQAKNEGFIHYLGFSSHYKDTHEIEAAIASDLFDVCELPYNIFHPDLAGLIELAYQHQMGVVNMKSFGGNQMALILPLLKPYLGFDYPVMLQYCLTNPHIATVAAGAKYPEEFAVDLQTLSAPSPPPEILAAYQSQAAKLVRNLNLDEFCRDCRHCQEKFTCSQGIDFPSILQLLTHWRLSVVFQLDGRDYRRAYQSLPVQADKCRECGLCEPWCEYELKIRELLKQAHELLH